MGDILITEEEKASFFMGEDAFERADLERKIINLERQLEAKDRFMEAAIRKVKDECQAQLDAEREERYIADKQLGAVYAGFTDPETLDEDSKDAEIRRLQIALANAKMMIDVVHTHTTGHCTLEQNNLVSAIRAWALPFDEDEDPAYENSLRELQYAHIRDIFQPHKTYTGAWTKDADPSKHPIKFLLQPLDEEENLEEK